MSDELDEPQTNDIPHRLSWRRPCVRRRISWLHQAPYNIPASGALNVALAVTTCAKMINDDDEDDDETVDLPLTGVIGDPTDSQAGVLTFCNSCPTEVILFD